MMPAYHRPSTLAEALALRAARPVTLLAGGTDLYPALAARRAAGDPWTPEVLDLGAIPDLSGIARTEEGWRIGAATRWAAVAEAALPPAFDGLRQAARAVGGRQVQARGTVGGNLCTASPAGDGIPNLLALEAAVELASPGGRRRLPLERFVTGYRATALAPDEILTALHLPDPGAARGGFAKLGARRHLVISIAMAAALVAVADGRIARARVAVGACSAVAQRLPALEAALAGVPASAAAAVPEARHLAPLDPIDDVRASAAYRLAAALVLLRDLLGELAR